ncbi:MAG: hypothetical protein HQ446_00625 [Polaromonas sp.]|nr:hypothetical protein [Polaromonas sp.]
MTGQAESAPESGGLSDLASFLADTPETESTEQDEEQTTADESTSDNADTDEPANDEQDDTDDEPQGDDEGEEPAPVDKITFKVKGEDGKEEVVEATTDDLAKSYMRQQDYTKKTQALAARENEAVQFLTTKHDEMRSQYLSQAELTRTAIVQMAGIKTEGEMAELANTDPSAWVAESQRQRQIGNYLNQLSQQIEGEKQQAKTQDETRLQQQRQKQFSESWEVLSKDGIDKAGLAKIYGGATDKYGFSNEELATVYDHRMVRVLKDAVAYQALKAQKPAVMQKAQNAPRMPSRQSAPAQQRIDQALDNKFKSGRAKLNDLAAFLR